MLSFGAPASLSGSAHIRPRAAVRGPAVVAMRPERRHRLGGSPSSESRHRATRAIRRRGASVIVMRTRRDRPKASPSESDRAQSPVIRVAIPNRGALPMRLGSRRERAGSESSESRGGARPRHVRAKERLPEVPTAAAHPPAQADGARQQVDLPSGPVASRPSRRREGSSRRRVASRGRRVEARPRAVEVVDQVPPQARGNHH